MIIGDRASLRKKVINKKIKNGKFWEKMVKILLYLQPKNNQK